MQIFAIKYGETSITEDGVFLGGNKEKEVEISLCIYLIKIAERNILIDAGCDNLPNFTVKNHALPVEMLKQSGLSADEITDVVITHAHYDHIASAHYFKNARFYIQKEEYEQGKIFLPNDAEVVLFDEEYALTKEILIKKIGGHSIGSCIAITDTSMGKYVFCGDEVYLSESIRKKIPTGASVNIENSLRFIKEYANENYTVLCCHDLILEGQNGIERIL